MCGAAAGWRGPGACCASAAALLSCDASTGGSVACAGALTEAQRAKRLKQVKKKLRQLAGLKAKRDEGVELNADQLEKLAGEPDLQEELASLESVSA